MSNQIGTILHHLSQEPAGGRRVALTNPFIPFRKEEIEQSIPDRFEQIVRKYPDHIAVKTKDQTLTYEELNKAANRIAHAILEQRGTKEEPIALFLEHGVNVLVAILGVLKAGKIYVPVDPSYPALRIASILEDSQTEFIVSNNHNILL